jgi:hypothetical protein
LARFRVFWNRPRRARVLSHYSVSPGPRRNRRLPAHSHFRRSGRGCHRTRACIRSGATSRWESTIATASEQERFQLGLPASRPGTVRVRVVRTHGGLRVRLRFETAGSAIGLRPKGRWEQGSRSSRSGYGRRAVGDRPDNRVTVRRAPDRGECDRRARSEDVRVDASTGRSLVGATHVRSRYRHLLRCSTPNERQWSTHGRS